MTYLFEELETKYKTRKDSLSYIKTSTNCFDYFKDSICSNYETLSEERFWSIYLNTRGRVIGYALISIGTSYNTTVDIKKIMKLALDTNARSIIILHNHPAGDSRPSDIDKALTQKIKDACNIMDLHLLDHIIIGENHFSFKDEGLL